MAEKTGAKNKLEKEVERKADEVGMDGSDVLTFFGTPAIKIEVSTEDEVTPVTHILHVHEAVLGQMSYFAVQKARWIEDSAALRFQLPQGTELKHFLMLLAYLYAPHTCMRFQSIDEGHHVSKIASMLLCERNLTEAISQALRQALKTDKDVKRLRELCNGQDTPTEIKRLTKRARLSPKELEWKELEMMLHHAAEAEDEVTLEFVGQHLKQRSRRGGSNVESVASILRKETAFAAAPLALEFLTAHPQYSGQFAVSCAIFVGGSGDDYTPGRLDLLKLCAEQHSAHSISDQDLLEAFKLFFRKFDDAEDSVTSIVCEVLRQLDVALQIRLVEELLGEKDDWRPGELSWSVLPHGGYAQSRLISHSRLSSSLRRLKGSAARIRADVANYMYNADFISAMALEAKDVFLDHVLQLPDDDDVAGFMVPSILAAFGSSAASKICERILNMPMHVVSEIVSNDFLNILGEAGMRKLLPVVCAFPPNVKARVLRSAAPRLGDDSDDGF